MKNKIICWNLEEKIIFDEGVQLITEGEHDLKRYYYHTNKESFEVIVVNSQNIKKISKYIRKNDKITVLVKDISDEYACFLNENLRREDIIYILANNIEEKDDIKLNGKIIYLPQLSNGEEKIHINPLLMILNNRGLLINKSSLIIGSIDKSSASSEIALFLLKRFKYVQNLNTFKLSIFSNVKLGIEAISYLKDPLLEYLQTNSIFEIKQLKQEENINNVYFSLICN